MFLIQDSIRIKAPLERCFLLSTALRIVERELGMHPAAGTFISEDGTRRTLRTEGLVSGGDRIRWEGWQLGLPQVHISEICNYERGKFFQDRMVEGRFRSFRHDHYFAQLGDAVELRDEIRFSMPLGGVGWLVGRSVLVPHIRELQRRRFALLKHIAESEEWREYLDET